MTGLLVGLSFLYATVTCATLFEDGTPTKHIVVPENETVEIVSPGYPNMVEPGSKLQWIFEGPENRTLLLICDDVFIFTSTNCKSAALWTWNGRNFKNFCGVTNHMGALSVSNQLKILLTGESHVGKFKCSVKVTPKVNDLAESSEDGEVKSKEDDDDDVVKTTSCPCGWSNKNKRIVGGKRALPNEFPFMVSLVGRISRNRVCGGTIITENHVLSAAHCLGTRNWLLLSVVLGKHRIQKQDKIEESIDVSYPVIHEKFNPKTLDNDIAIVVLVKPIKFRREIGPVCLPEARYNLQNEYLKALGWGETKLNGLANTLKKVDLRVIDIETCSANYDFKINTKTVSQLCTFSKNKDTCLGDSGGPLIWLDPETNRYVQMALVSFGRDCGGSSPAVNTDVFYFMSWIKKIVQKTQSRAQFCVKV